MGRGIDPHHPTSEDLFKLSSPSLHSFINGPIMMDKPDPMDVKSSYDGSVSIGTPIDGHLFVIGLVVGFEIAVVL